MKAFYLILVALPTSVFAFDWSNPLGAKPSQETKQAATKDDSKPEVFFKSCQQSALTTLLNTVKDAKSQYADIEKFCTEKCGTLKTLRDKGGLWGEVKDPKFEGCTWGVDAAIGQSPQDDALRKKFKSELCL